MADPDTTLPSTSARVRVLTNPDLLHGIFSSVPFTRDIDLARCARVCRSFHEPVIRVLWRNLDALLPGPLWHLLAPPDTPFPSAYCYDVMIDGRKDVLAYFEKISLAQAHLDPIRWERFLWHARHVRGIHFHSPVWNPANDVVCLLVQTAVEQNGGTTVLPLLRSIQWLGRVSESEESAVVQFFTPTLRHVSLQFAGSDEEVIVLVLRQLRKSSPSLEKLAVDVGYELDTGSSVIQELLSFPRLDHVRVGQTGSQGFQALVTKPNLVWLEIEEVAGPWVGLDPPISVRDLCYLSLRGDAFVISSLFDILHFLSLQSTKIFLDCPEGMQITSTDITTFLARFHNAVSTSGLLALQFGLDLGNPMTPDADDDEPMANLRDLLAPILRIHDLRLFHLEVRGAIAKMDDADIEALATAWPEINSLSLAEGMVYESRVTLSGIHQLYRHCTRLEELSLSCFRFPIIEVHEIPAPLDRSLFHPLQHLAMEDLGCVLTSRIPSMGPALSEDGTEAMARYFLDLFPNLDRRRYARELYYSSPERRGPLPVFMHYDDRWRKVIGHIYDTCSIRSRT